MNLNEIKTKSPEQIVEHFNQRVKTVCHPLRFSYNEFENYGGAYTWKLVSIPGEQGDGKADYKEYLSFLKNIAKQKDGPFRGGYAIRKGDFLSYDEWKLKDKKDKRKKWGEQILILLIIFIGMPFLLWNMLSFILNMIG